MTDPTAKAWKDDEPPKAQKEEQKKPEPKPEPKAAPKAKAGSWSPIDTALDDPDVKAGGDVLLALMPGGRQVVGRYDAGLVPTAGWALEGRAIEPTHWQPLGPLPTPDKADKGGA